MIPTQLQVPQQHEESSDQRQFKMPVYKHAPSRIAPIVAIMGLMSTTKKQPQIKNGDREKPIQLKHNS